MLVRQVPVNKTLQPLSLSATSINESANLGARVGSLLGKTLGSTVILTNSVGTRFALGGSGESLTIVRGTTPLTPGSFTITVRETKAGFKNSPADTPLTVTVTPVGAPGTLDFSKPVNSGLLLLLEDM